LRAIFYWMLTNKTAQMRAVLRRVQQNARPRDCMSAVGH